MKRRCSDMLLKTISAFMETLPPEFEEITGGALLLTRYCDLLDRILDDSDGVLLDCAVDMDDMSVRLLFESEALDVQHPQNDLLHFLISVASGVCVESAGHERLRVLLIFPGIWAIGGADE